MSVKVASKLISLTIAHEPTKSKEKNGQQFSIG
jgi:hypothetical protein